MKVLQYICFVKFRFSAPKKLIFSISFRLVSFFYTEKLFFQSPTSRKNVQTFFPESCESEEHAN